MPLLLTFLFGFYCITLPGGFQPGGEKRTFFAVSLGPSHITL